MADIFTVDEYNKLIPQFMKAMKPYIEGKKSYTVDMQAILDPAPWFDTVKHYHAVHAFCNDQEYMQQYVDFFKPEFPALEAKELCDTTTIARLVDGKCATAISMQVFTVPGDTPATTHLVNLCMVFMLKTSEEHRRQGHARQLLYSIAMYLREQAVAQRGGPKASYILVLSSKKLGPFYKKLGFVAADTCFKAWGRSGYTLLQCRVVSDQYFGWEDEWFGWVSRDCGREIPACLYRQRKLSEPIVDIDAQVNQEEEEEKKETDSIAESTMTKITTKSRGGAVHKHCTTGKCGGKRIAGGNWAIHASKQHAGVADISFTKCTEDCRLCEQGSNDYKGDKPSYPCVVCGVRKRSDQCYNFTKAGPNTCDVCAKQGKAKTVIGFSVPLLPSAGSKRPISSILESLPKDSTADQLSREAPIVYMGIDGIGYSENEQYPDGGGADDGFDIPSPISKRPKQNNQVYEQQQQQQQQDTLSSIGAQSATYVLGENLKMITHTDVQVIKQLQVMETNSKSIDYNAQIVQKVCAQFSQELLVSYFQQGLHPVLIDCINAVVQRINDLSDDAATGLFVAAFVLGGTCWNSLVNAVTRLDSGRKETICNTLSFFVAKTNSAEITGWFIENLDNVTIQHLALMQYFSKKADEYDTQVLTLASVVAVTNTADFVEYATSMLQGTVNTGALLLSGLAANNKQRAMSFDAFIGLCTTLQQSKYTETIEGLKDRLVSSQMIEWEQLIKESHALAAIVDADSIQAFLNELIEKYGSIARLKEDITKSDKRFAILKACDVGMPNNMQSALSQYCVGNTYTQQRQVWVVPSGQGKSRIAKMSAAIMIACNAASVVHMVYSSQYLMQRDRVDAANMFTMLGITDEQVKYHSSLEFELNEGEFVIIDEVDDIIFNQPAQFIEKFASCRYLGFTATTAANPTEEGLMESLKLKAYSYMLNNDVTQYDLSADSVTASTTEAKVAYIKQLSATSPVLVYGSMELCTQLLMSGALFVNTAVNSQQLRALDQRDPFSNAYKIVVCNDMFGMRGIDYRSNSVTLTLVIAQPYKCKRDAIQGFGRVGRCGDAYKRVRFDDVQIIDKEAEQALMAAQLKVVGDLNKKVHLKPIQNKLPPSSQSSVVKKTNNKPTTTMTANRVKSLLKPAGPTQGKLMFGIPKDQANE